MSQARTTRSASLIWISLAAAVGLSGCMGSKERVFPQESPTMKQIYDGHFKSMGAAEMDRARLEMHGREYWVVDEKSSTAKNKAGEIVRTQRVLAEPRPVASGDADLEGYTRTAENEISGRFPRLPNPTLVMFVFPHLGPGGTPIPGYSTTVPMYDGVEYAMPGESPLGGAAMSAVMQPDLRDQARAQPPAWAGETIQPWDEPRARALAAFVTRDYWTDQGSINVFRVIGTEHVDYQGLSWLEFLERGKRMDQNLALHAANPGYYRETGRKVPGMYYRSLDGLSWYVGADGNHRTCLARFDFHGRGLTTLHGVTLSHTVADLELFGLHERLREVCLERRLGERIEPHRELLRREDTAGWKLDHTLVSLQMSAPDGDTRLLDAQAARAQLRALEAPPRRRWWRIAG